MDDASVVGKNIRWILTVLVCLTMHWSVSLAQEVMSHEEVGRALAQVIEPLAGRQLTAQEVSGVTQEFVPLLGNEQCLSRCVEMVHYNLARIRPVIESPGTPLDLRTRHDYISQLYFSPTQSGSLIQGLMTGADPIAVVENAPQRLMTRLDVIASMDLYQFVYDAGPPKAKRHSENDIQSATDTLNRVYGSKKYVMPRHLPLAAEYWRGLELSWSGLSADEQGQVRAYFAGQIRRPLSRKLYGILLGLNATEAANFRQQAYQEAMFAVTSRRADVLVLIEELRGFDSLWLPR